jgi:hypothetical protein
MRWFDSSRTYFKLKGEVMDRQDYIAIVEEDTAQTRTLRRMEAALLLQEEIARDIRYQIAEFDMLNVLRFTRRLFNRTHPNNMEQVRRVQRVLPRVKTDDELFVFWAAVLELWQWNFYYLIEEKFANEPMFDEQSQRALHIQTLMNVERMKKWIERENPRELDEFGEQEEFPVTRILQDVAPNITNSANFWMKSVMQDQTNRSHNETKIKNAVSSWEQSKTRSREQYVPEEIIANTLPEPRYKLVAVIDERTGDICLEKDGRTFPISEANCTFTPEGTLPPFHRSCRTTIRIL